MYGQMIQKKNKKKEKEKDKKNQKTKKRIKKNNKLDFSVNYTVLCIQECTLIYLMWTVHVIKYLG